MPVGSRPLSKHRRLINLDKLLRAKRCIIQIKNKDKLCCARAIVTAIAMLSNDPHKNAYKKGNTTKRSIQSIKARELHEAAGVPFSECRLNEIALFQKHLSPQYQILVISKDNFNGIIYCGNKESDKKIILYLHDGHYDIIRSMPAFMERSYFCFKCHKGHNNKRHACQNICTSCFTDCKSTINYNWIKCPDCGRSFKGEKCLKKHKHIPKKGKSTCQKYKKCETCNKTYDGVRKLFQKGHMCDETFCHNCNDFVSASHMCYIKTIAEKRASHPDIKSNNMQQTKYIFFDFECIQETGTHIPNLCIVYAVCSECISNPISANATCKNCKKNQRVFSGINTRDEFCQWLFSEENNNATCIAHNFKGYDSYFILQYLYNNAIVPKIIYNGAKIMYIHVPFVNVRFIDSFNFLPMALSKLPKSFGFEELCKGYFPHFFNTNANQHVIQDHLPHIDYYGPNAMSIEGRQKFIAWYETHKNDFFNFQKEIQKYCESDVHILAKACLIFWSMFMHATANPDNCIFGVDPFESSITIASACNLVFRTNHLEPNTIGIIPQGGYNRAVVQSYF